MYALIFPALLPFILLGAVTGLSWWEDRMLPPTAPVEVPAEAPQTPLVPVPDPQQARIPIADFGQAQSVVGPVKRRRPFAFDRAQGRQRAEAAER